MFDILIIIRYYNIIYHEIPHPRNVHRRRQRGNLPHLENEKKKIKKEEKEKEKTLDDKSSECRHTLILYDVQYTAVYSLQVT